MGKIFAPSYANLFMAYFEEKFFSSFGYRPPFYGRYLDDIFIIWTEGAARLELFLNALNAFHPSIKLTSTTSTEEIDFLDITVFKELSGLLPPTFYTKVHFKVTNTHRLLHKHSFHPRHTFAGIIKGQLSRFHRLCSFHKDFNLACRTLFNALRDMNYSRRSLKQTLHDFLLELWTPARRPNPTPTTHPAPGLHLPYGQRTTVYSVIGRPTCHP